MQSFWMDPKNFDNPRRVARVEKNPVLRSYKLLKKEALIAVFTQKGKGGHKLFLKIRLITGIIPVKLLLVDHHSYAVAMAHTRQPVDYLRLLKAI